MIKVIVKRDGREEPYNQDKVRNAVSKAFIEIDGSITLSDEDIIRKITNEISDLKNKKMTVEEVQDVVEKKLMQSSRKDVAKAYILYRDKRTRERHKKSELMKLVGKRLQASNVQNQNANVDEHSFGGRKGEAANEIMKDYALNYCMSEKSKANHLNNEIYIHDLDSYAIGMHNCLSVPFDDLLANGFNTRQTDVRPAQSVSTAFQLVAVIFQIQSLQQFGGVAATHLDWTMIPYVRKSFTKHLGDGLRYVEKLSEYKTKRFHKWIENDKENHPDGTIHFDDTAFKEQHNEAWEYAYDMTVKETYQAVEGMFHNLNTLQSRSGKN